MVMSVSSLAQDYGDPRYQTRSFRNVIEDHLDYLRVNHVREYVPLTPVQNDKFRFDFSGLLFSLNVPGELHWVTMRVNGLKSSADFLEEKEVIILLNASGVRSVFDRHLTLLSQL